MLHLTLENDRGHKIVEADCSACTINRGIIEVESRDGYRCYVPSRTVTIVAKMDAHTGE